MQVFLSYTELPVQQTTYLKTDTRLMGGTPRPLASKASWASLPPATAAARAATSNHATRIWGKKGLGWKAFLYFAASSGKCVKCLCLSCRWGRHGDFFYYYYFSSAISAPENWVVIIAMGLICICFLCQWQGTIIYFFRFFFLAIMAFVIGIL